MILLHGIVGYLLPFLVVLTVLVFVHEFGHYWVARRNGVRIVTFSIGFGPELFGFTDRAGTRWKFSAIPLGGYVKMFGDADPASTPDAGVAAMTPEERAVSFFHKRIGQRAAIVAAGPVANFLFALVVLAGLFMLYGQPYTPPVVGMVEPRSAAAAAGIEPGDTIRTINGSRIERFEDIQEAVRFNTGTRMAIGVRRGGKDLTLDATPRMSTVTDRFGNKQQYAILGIGHSGVDYRRLGPVSAVWQAGHEVVSVVGGTVDAIGQMIAGQRGTQDLGGPLRIAQMSGEVAQNGVGPLVWFMALLSINLGLINLVPVPMLDGGHLLFYALEAARGRPLGERAQEYGFRIGLALVLTLVVFATWNDLVHLRVVDLVRSLIS